MSLGIPEDERVYAYWLHSVPWIGQGPVPAILKHFGSAREAFYASDEEMRLVAGKRSDLSGLLSFRKDFDIFEKYGELNRSGIGLVFA